MKYPAIWLLWLYKYTLSPAFSALGLRCRYEPGCSTYSIQAISKYGFWRGGWMTLARLQRCHPIDALGGSSGIDKVPETVQKAPFWAPWRYGVWRHSPNCDYASEHTDTQS
ncbi:membrane protein insertion efficiency factor YidD [Robiginitomaculum antarcticum]|uniref:membrane protein insertion efficiency factor YidD n=1 Tax=Robiginitomaculum antarcticum TaxID=437507 RepID=UPI00037CFEEE|nr:membrane protein insertion efficiency factor YidD [Robiginitomaculum antarcticum]